jgi:uncharacterized protein with von Willebrand factor type A (vWA) domain
MTVLTGYVGFARALRQAGVGCGPDRVQAYVAAVEHLDPGNRDELYWAGRLTLCGEPDDLPRYDAAFAAWFGGEEPRGSRRRTPRATQLAALDGGTAQDGRAGQLATAASDTEVLRHKDIAGLTPAEKAHLRELIATLRPEPPRRRALRAHRARTGALDPGRTLRAMLATGGEPAKPRYRRKGTRPRKVVLLVDVSGSMSPYADALLRFAHVVARAMPTEVCTLGTRLTRISRQLKHRDAEFALTSATRAVPDYEGGTRLGETIKVFLDRWGQRGVARRAVVVLFSDGWERGDPALLGEQLARLRRLAHAVVWVNPHAGKAGYAPTQSGIIAALPHVDRLLAGHSLDTLRHLLKEISRA